MFCINCGTQLDGQPKFCHRCGQQVTPVSQPPPPRHAEPAGAVSRAQPGKWRRRLLGCSVLLLVMALACGAGAATLYFYLGLHQTNQTAAIAPANTTAFISFSPSLLQANQLHQLADPNYQAAILLPVTLLPGVMEVNQLLDQHWPQSVGINVTNDILPWMGREVSLAVLDASQKNAGAPARIAGNPEQDEVAYTGPPLILTAVTRNSSRSTTFLVNLRRQLEAEGFVFENSVYEGILLTEVVSPPQVPLAYASFNNLVVLATDTSALRIAIDTAMNENAPALVEQTTFTAMLDSLPANRLGHLYLDLPAILEQFPETVRPWFLDSPSQAALAISLTGSGVRYAYALQYDPLTLTIPQEEWLRLAAVPNRLGEFAPANSVLLFSGQDLLLFWELYFGQNGREIVQELQESTGVHLINDLLALAPAEFAWIILQDTSGQEIPVGLLLLAQVTDPDRVQSSLTQMFQQIDRTNRDATFYQDELDRVPVWVLENQLGEFIGFGFFGETLFLGTSRDVLRTAVRAGRISLANQELYQAATGPLPNQGSSYLYADVGLGLRLLDRLSDSYVWEGNEELRLQLRQIRAISMATTPMDQAGVMQGVVYILID